MTQSNQKNFDELLQNLSENIKQFKQEADAVGRAVLDNQLKKMDIVTREEFDALQSMVIAMHAKLDRIEQALQNTPPSIEQPTE